MRPPFSKSSFLNTNAISPSNRSAVRFELARTAIWLLAALCLACSDRGPDPATLTVSAASSLTFAFEEIVPLFERETDVPVTCAFGATGQLSLQIEQGAPVDVFAAAGAGFVDRLAAGDLIAPGSRHVFCRGDLVIWVRDDSPLHLQGLGDLTAPAVARIAVAHPEYAPYGAAARQALVAASLWERLQPKLVLGRTARQALQYAETGDVDAAVVPRALATRAGGRWMSVAPALYSPVDQIIVAIASSRADSHALAFVEFLLSPTVQAILGQHGFRSLDRPSPDPDAATGGPS
jgi:molybdate transport system substrate-binding protein